MMAIVLVCNPIILLTLNIFFSIETPCSAGQPTLAGWLFCTVATVIVCDDVHQPQPQRSPASAGNPPAEQAESHVHLLMGTGCACLNLNIRKHKM